MNNKALSVLFIILLCILVGCSKKLEKRTSIVFTTPETEEQAETETCTDGDQHYDLSKLPEKIQKVISKDASFIDADEDKSFTLTSYKMLTTADEAVHVVWKDYIIEDIDLDGENELIVHINNIDYVDSVSESVRILDLQKDEVYCYSYPYRGVKHIYEDGVMEGSTGAQDSRLYTAKYDELSKEDIIVAESVSTFENDIPSVDYFIGKDKVTKEDFYEYIKKYSLDNSISWSENYLVE